MYLDTQKIEKLIKEYENDTKALKEELLKLCWYMRGSMSVTESYSLTVEDRLIIGKIIEENLETTKNTQLPFF